MEKTPENKPSVVSIGEIMIELSGIQADGAAKIGFAGDTANTAIYLSRLFRDNGRVGYLSRLGQGDFSEKLASALSNENVEVSPASHALPGTPGLYAITTDDEGERSFTYWRESAPVRQLFEGAPAPDERMFASEFDCLYISGITLAVLSDAGRSTILELAKRFVAGGKQVMFDVNFRPHLWKSHSPDADVPAIVREMIATSTILKIGRDEGEWLFGIAASADLIADLNSLGEATLVVTDGADRVYVDEQGQLHEVSFNVVEKVIDSTAAGDSFSAGYLHAALSGKGAVEAVKAGQKLAACVIQHPGAIIPLSEMPK